MSKIYVDPLCHHGMQLYGRSVESCRMFTDTVDLTEPTAPHFDLIAPKRAAAILCGAIPVTREEAIEIWGRARGA
jgi:hypothetical protein